MKKNFLIKVCKTNLSHRIQSLSSTLKINYFFELILMRDILHSRNFGKKSLAELDSFIDERISEEEKEWLWEKTEKILKVRVIDTQTLFNSREFKTLIKTLKNPNLDWEQASDFNKKFIYQKLSEVMVNKLVQVSGVFPRKPLGYFFQPNQYISLSVEASRKNSVERYSLPIEDFQKRIKKLLIKQLIYEIKKPDD